MKASFETVYLDKNLATHVNKHRADYINDPRFLNIDETDFIKKYYEIAYQLAIHKVSKAKSNDRFVGFIGTDCRKIKYDRKHDDLVIYKNDSIISLFKITEREYNQILNRDFKKEFEYNMVKD